MSAWLHDGNAFDVDNLTKPGPAVGTDHPTSGQVWVANEEGSAPDVDVSEVLAPTAAGTIAGPSERRCTCHGGHWWVLGFSLSPDTRWKAGGPRQTIRSSVWSKRTTREPTARQWETVAARSTATASLTDGSATGSVGMIAVWQPDHGWIPGLRWPCSALGSGRPRPVS